VTDDPVLIGENELTLQSVIDVARSRRSVRLAPGARERGEPRREPGLVHAVARERISEPGRVADERDSARGERRAVLAKRQTVATHARQGAGIESVRLAEPCEVNVVSLVLPRTAVTDEYVKRTSVQEVDA